MARRRWPSILAVSFLLTACNPGLPPAAGVPVTSPATAAIGTATVRFTIGSPMAAQALAKTLADVHHYEVQLYDAGDALVTASGLTNPLTVTAPATSGSFTHVPAGTGYYLTVEAFDAAGASISQGGAIKSANSFDVSGATVTYSSGTAVTFALKLLDATPGTGSSTLTLNNADDQLTGADRYGVALYNRASRRATANPLSTSSSYNLDGVQTGSSTPFEPTHELWVYVVNSATGTASRARAFNVDALDSANPDGEIAPTLTYSLYETELATLPNTSATAITDIRTDAVNRVYFATASSIVRVGSEGGSPTTVLTFATPPAGWCVDLDGNLYVTDGSGIERRAAGNYGTATPAVTAGNVGRLAVDEAGNLYWHDTAAGKILKAVRSGTAYGAPITVASGVGPAALLAVNAVGDVYYSDGADWASLANVHRVPLSPDHTTYGASAQVVTKAGLTSLAVDRVGNIYFTDGGSPYVQFVGAGNDPTMPHTVAGNGVGTTGGVNLSGVPTDTAEIVEPGSVTVSIDGRVYFASKATASTQEIRRIF